MKTFDDRFRAMYGRITSISHKYARTTPIPYEEYESLLCEEFIKIDASYQRGTNNNYAAYVGTMLDSKAKRLASDGGRSTTRKFYDSLTYIDEPDQDDDGADYSHELISEVDVEQEVFDVMFVEEQLALAEGDTKAILQEFFRDPSASFREIGRKVGLDYRVVQRRLQKVAEAVRQA